MEDKEQSKETERNKEAILREKAHSVCAEYVGGVWKTITKDDIVIEQIYPYGFLKEVIKLSLPVNCKTLDGEPRDLIMKNDLHVFVRGKFDLMTENIIVMWLAEKKITPEVIGIYEGGRLDEFVPSRLLTPADVDNSKIMGDVARILARIHSLKPPISKRLDKKYDNVLEDMITQIINHPGNQRTEDIEMQSIFKSFQELNPREELKWLLKKRDAVNNSTNCLVFTHGDIKLDNILLCNDGIIQLIDFGMSAYNYRGNDFGSLFRSFCIDYTRSCMKSDMNKFPSEEKQHTFFRIYLEEFQTKTENDNLEKEVKTLIEETKIFTLIWHFSIMLHAFVSKLIKEDIEKTEFSDYVINMEAYSEHKKDFYKN